VFAARYKKELYNGDIGYIDGVPKPDPGGD
jgi:hypothetical protein